MGTIVALYVDPRGPYPKLADLSWGEQSPGRVSIDCWDATRDARLYAGPHPVVAHPPCKHWGRLRHLAKDAVCAACDGTGFASGCHDADLTCGPCRGTGRVSDRDCAPRAIRQVRAFGGVLEHPAGSLLWEAAGLPKPKRCKNAHAPDYSVCPDCGDLRDSFGYTIEVDQVEWGHVARKRTWLYLVGVPREALEAPPFPGREPTHYIGGGRTKSSRKGGAIPEGKKATSETQRRRTPPLFAEYLVRLARSVQK